MTSVAYMLRFVAFGAAAAVAAALVKWLASPVVGPYGGLLIGVAVAALVLGLAQLVSVRGRLVTTMAWLALCVVLAVGGFSFDWVSAVLAMALWLHRCIFVHRSILRMAMDLLLVPVALSAGYAAAATTGSVAICTAAFVLVSAVALIPVHAASHVRYPRDPFKQAVDSAEASLKALGQ